MTAKTLQGRGRLIGMSLVDALHSMSISAILAGAAGWLFGTAFGGFEAMLRHDLWKVAWVGAYCGLCGVFAGALLGFFGNLFQNETFGQGELKQPTIRSGNPKQATQYCKRRKSQLAAGSFLSAFSEWLPAGN